MKIPQTVNRLLLCTSPLQVMTARAAMEANQRPGETYRDVLMMIHPENTSQSKVLIRKYAEKLGYAEILDFSYEYGHILKLLQGDAKLRRIPFWGWQQMRKRHSQIADILSSIRQTLDVNNAAGFNEVYTRHRVGTIETVVLMTTIPHRRLYGIEDGMGDYYYTWRSPRRLMSGFIRTLKGVYVWLIYSSKSLSWQYNSYALPYLHWMPKKFTNLPYKSNIVVGESFKKNLVKAFECDKNGRLSEGQVVILGTLFDVDSASFITTKREVEIYNALIGQIKERHGVSSDQILYKPHPGISRDTWDYKKGHLNSQIYPYGESPIFEAELVKHHFKAVYSMGSTSLLIAKALFGVDSYLIDLRGEKIRPWKMWKMNMIHDILTHYGVIPVKV